MRGTKKKMNSIRDYVKWILMVLVPLILIYSGISVASAVSFRHQIEDYAETFMDFYMQQIDDTISNINSRMSMFVLSENETGENLNKYIYVIETTDNMALCNYYSNQLRDVFLMYSAEYGTYYNFFSFLPEKGLFIGANANNHMDPKEWETYREDIINKLETQSLVPNSGTQYWQLVSGENGYNYILKLYYFNNVYVGCWIRPEDLIEPLENAFKDYRNSVYLYDADNSLISSKGPDVSEAAAIKESFRTIPFKVEMTIADYGLFEKTFLINMVLSLIALAIFITILFSAAVLYKRVMKPIKNFSDNLENIEKKQLHMDKIASNELVELEQANAKFRQLIQTITALQNKVYEEEMKKQMMYMEYLKLQIEPHFYLNCLNFIYNMIDLKQYSQASLMAAMTAGYMRYLFNNERNLVYLWEELEHIEHYLKIQKLRFGQAFEYYLEQDDESREVKIPPLIIQTFVENSVKYAMSFDDRLMLTVTVYSENINNQDYASICIMDNGPGFSAELLKKLENTDIYAENENNHIGISNAIKRLKFTYNSLAKIHFYNSPLNGAVVEIHIPSDGHAQRRNVHEYADS